MIESLAISKKVLESVAGPLFGSISSYLNIRSYLGLRWTELRSGKRSYFREEEYWQDVLGEDFYTPSNRKLVDGCIVELQQFEISEWFPRAAGSFWTKHGHALRVKADDHLEYMGKLLVYSPSGKYLMMQGGLGTLRLEPHGTGEAKYKVLGATSSGNLSSGVPVVVPISVYEKIQDRLLTQHSFRATITGVYTRLPISEREMVLEAAGAELPQPLRSWIATSHYVPRTCVLVESILTVEDAQPSLGVQGAAWSVYQSHNGGYGCTYAGFDPHDGSSLNRATDFLNTYSSHHDGGRFLTEFDERTKRLNAEWPIDDVVSKNIDITTEAKSILNWSRNVQILD